MSRYEKANTIPGTRSCHHFRPVSETEIHGKKFSNDDINVIDYFFVNPTQNFYNVNVLPNDYTTCIYDGDCWVVLVESVNVEEQDATCNFLHYSGKPCTYYWPQREDRAYVPLNKFIAILDPPMSSSNGRKYIFDKAQIENSYKSFQSGKNSTKK